MLRCVIGSIFRPVSRHGLVAAVASILRLEPNWRRNVLPNPGCWNNMDHNGPACSNSEFTELKEKLSKIASNEERKVGAVVNASIYNDLVDFHVVMEQPMSSLVRIALKKFVAEYRDALKLDPVQLSLDLSLLEKGA